MIDQKYVNRFWSYVNKLGPDDCWEWNGARQKFGYGVLNIKGEIHLAHRMSAGFAGMDTYGKHVCHKCDNPPCVNPNHFFIGTQKDNTMDAWNKGRLPKPPVMPGEKNPAAKLSEKEVLYAMNSKDPSRKVGRKLGVSKTTILRIRNGKNWKHLFK